MKVYIAAPFVARDLALAARKDLAEHNISCTARWLDTHLDDKATPVELAREAVEDIEDVRNSDALVLICNKTIAPLSQGGMHIETGYALAMGIPVVLVGERLAVFHYMSDVSVVSDVHSAVAVLNLLDEKRKTSKPRSAA